MKGSVCRWLKRLVCAILVVVGAGSVITVVAPQWVLPPLARYLDISETPHPVDYVLVLNGDPETRPYAAAALIKVGYAQKVLLTKQQLTLESATVQDGGSLSELEITQKVLRQRGVPMEAVEVLPGEIGGTADEARALAAFLKTRPGATVAVVTNGFHTRRARLVFDKMLGERASQVSFVGVPRERVDEATWWRTPQGCTVYLSEYAKLPYYWLRY